MAEADIDAIIATPDDDVTWGDNMRGAIATLKATRTAWPPYISGQYYEPQSSFASSTVDAQPAMSANRFVLLPFVARYTFSIDLIGLEVTTGVASATSKMVIYEANATSGLPDALMLETATLDCSAAAFVSVACSETFNAGSMYWIGARHSSNQNVRGMATSSIGSALPVYATSGTNKTVFALSKTKSYAVAADDPGTAHFSWSDGHRANAVERPIFRVA